jgi:hypothetical protein
MAFLGDFGKFFGLGSSEEVLGDLAAATASAVGGGPSAQKFARGIGESVGSATSSLAGGGTADQPLEQSALPTPRPEDLLVRQETARSGSTFGMQPNIISAGNFSTSRQQQAGLGFLAPVVQAARGFFSAPAIATGVGATAVSQFMGNMGGSRMRPVLTQSRRNKARVRQLVNFMGIEGAADFLSQSSGRNITGGDVVQLLLRTFRNDGAYITKAQVRNLRRTTNKFKTLEKQVKEATSMTRSTRRASPMRRASNTTLIKN